LKKDGATRHVLMFEHFLPYLSWDIAVCQLVITAYQHLSSDCIRQICPTVPCRGECFSCHTLVRAYGFDPEPVKLEMLCWVSSCQSSNQVNQTEVQWQRFLVVSFTSGMMLCSFWISLSWMLMILWLVVDTLLVVGTSHCFLKLSVIIPYF